MMTREEISGVIGTAISLALLLLILFFSYFTLAAPPEELEGIPVMFGYTDEASGNTESPMNEVEPIPLQQPSPPDRARNQPLITQTTEPTIDVAAQREAERRQAQREEQRRAQEEAARKQREEEARRREINRQMSGLFGENTGSRGQTQGAATQGVSTGNDTQGAASGVGGIGSFDLGGRSLGRGGLAQPNYSVNDYGTVVVNITVDPQGNVIQAEIGRGTNTPSATLRNEALRAARRTKFNAINSANNQNGTITYKFNLN